MIKKTAFNGFYLLFSIFAVWIFCAGFLYSSGSMVTRSGLLIFFAFAFVAVTFAAVRLPEIPKKAYKICVAVIFAVFFIAITFFGIRTMTAPISDLKVLIEAADCWLEKGNIISYSHYFTICKNTLGNAIFIMLMYIPVHALGINIFSNTAEAWGITVNCIMIVLAVFFLYRIAVRFFKNRNMHIVFLLLCCVYIPFYLWAHRYYSDTLALPFLTGSVLLYLKGRESSGKKQIVCNILCGIVLWAGYFMKGSIVITLVAVIIFSAFCDKKDVLKNAGIILISFVISLSVWNFYVNHNSWIDYSHIDTDNFPVTMWLMYGAHDEGNYSQADVDYMYSLPDYESRKAAAAEKLKEYYSAYTPKTYIEFLNLKYGITYGNGMFDSEQYLNNQRTSNFTHYFLIEGLPFTMLFRYISNALHFTVLILAVISGFINWRRKEWNAPMLLQIIMLGNILFFSFWETKARYAFGITPVLLFLAVYSAGSIAEYIQCKLNNKKHSPTVKENIAV